MVKRTGFIGLGRMGNPMCRYLLKAGFDLVVHDLQPEAMTALVALGAHAAQSPKQVAQQSDAIFVMVTDDDQVRRVVNDLVEGASPGLLIAICSSVHPKTCRDLEAIARARGASLVDAPVARGTRGAEAGTLTVFVGGERAAFELLRPVFAAFSEHVLYMGPIGAGQVTKTCNNLLHWAGIVACYEALTLGARLGIPPNDLRPALLAGSADSRTLRELDLVGLYWPQKDMETALALADESQTPIPLMIHVKDLVKDISVNDLRGLFRD